MTIIILLGIRFMAPPNFYTQLKTSTKLQQHTRLTWIFNTIHSHSHLSAGQVHVLMGLCNKAPSKSHVAFYIY